MQIFDLQLQLLPR